MKDLPYLNEWRNRLRKLTEPRGKKVELARYLMGNQATTIESCKVIVHRILNENQNVEGETVLKISAWMDSQTL